MTVEHQRERHHADTERHQCEQEADAAARDGAATVTGAPRMSVPAVRPPEAPPMQLVVGGDRPERRIALAIDIVRERVADLRSYGIETGICILDDRVADIIDFICFM